ncbi:hypothetical protein GH714_014245 [Hevea brasiliensis]|uniref:Leucine-rich repeat-containing N-terminal plant-type domain-containing protein n=1 Tax=Hevea brasiliensis TaxID=3981 RepID=A0A6A6KL23_HEVBR|nr:hypothetical protein GH714_014245 [Hevea brasiliensis]
MGYQSISSLPESYTDDCCQWEGVFCSLTSSHVVRIFFDPLGEGEGVLWYPDMKLFAQIKELQNYISQEMALVDCLTLKYNLQTLDLSNNFLEGAIPYQLGQLHELHSLNLSNNLLTGHIPKSFEKITSLESLDLSYNRLTGQIPQEISHMSSLTTLRLAFNDLSGRIPFEGQLSTFSESSYVGNPKLCGDPLERKCSENTNDVNQDDGNEEKEDHRVIDEPLFFYSFVFMSYALGFWSVVAPLCFSRNWRKKYYTAIDGCVNYVRCSK